MIKQLNNSSKNLKAKKPPSTSLKSKTRKETVDFGELLSNRNRSTSNIKKNDQQKIEPVQEKLIYANPLMNPNINVMKTKNEKIQIEYATTTTKRKNMPNNLEGISEPDRSFFEDFVNVSDANDLLDDDGKQDGVHEWLSYGVLESHHTSLDKKEIT